VTAPVAQPGAMPEIALIAAMDRRGAIGRGNALPWRLPEDLRRFKAATMGGTLLMGRRTAESLGRALPGRRNLVLTRSGRVPYAGMQAVTSLDEALAACTGETLWVIGGGEVYRLALPRAGRLLLTLVDTEIADADAFFPALDPAGFVEVASEAYGADARHPWPLRFVEYRRRFAPRSR
jgi:dihydrofolate reductase